MNKTTTTDGLSAGIFGGVIFVVFFIFFPIIGLDVGLFLSILFAVVAFGAGWFFLFERKKPEILEREAGLKVALEEGDKNLSAIRVLERQIKRPSILNKIKNIESILQSILIDLKKDPNKLRNAKQLLDYYVPTTIKILTKYVELSSQGTTSGGIQTSLTKVETMLGKIGDAFDEQHARLLSNDVMDLDNELATLDQTINMDGLTKDQ
jgi:5-bromo-4-chloroindolyl phosphate hydrolysis protein